jgi:mono/diheme cytochrome c family protein
MKLAVALVTIGLTTAAARSAALHAALQQVAPAAGRSVWDGVYTEGQAKRGALRSGFCVGCHGDGFVGGPAPELAGDAFASKWNGRTVGDLFDLVRRTMPDDDPGSLSKEQYADLIAYILAVNKYPTGSSELGTETEPLQQIRIEASKP